VLNEQVEQPEIGGEEHDDGRRTGREAGIGEYPDVEQRFSCRSSTKPNSTANTRPPAIEP